MFFPFCSDHVYEEEVWAAVWVMEVAINSVLLEELQEPTSVNLQSSSDLAVHIKTQIREYGFYSKILEEGVSGEWVDDLLNSEAETIFAFLLVATKLSSDEAWALLKPKVSLLSECVRRSAPFHKRIAELGFQAKQAQADHKKIPNNDG
ncbi:MAG: hypothetical protein AMXMBFR84_34300 [Candidatus Hydrogenedentota bacterium]